MLDAGDDVKQCEPFQLRFGEAGLRRDAIVARVTGGVGAARLNQFGVNEEAMLPVPVVSGGVRSNLVARQRAQ